MRATKKLFVILFSLTFLNACLPEEIPLSQESLDGDKSYDGFKGLDLVETVSASKVQLKWSLTNDRRVVAYNVYDVTLSSAPRLIKSIDSDSSEATIAGLSEGFYYKFRVRAVDRNNNEDTNTNDLVGIPYGGVTDSEVISSSSVKINYTDPSDGEALQANVYCKTADDSTWQLMANIRNMTLTSAVVENLEPNVTYTCKVNIVVDGIEDNNKETVTFTALGKAHEIVFSTQPGNAQAGEVMLQQPVVQILDENGNIVSGGPDSTALITLEVSVDSPTNGTVRGTYTVNALAGVAYFSDINFQEAGIKIVSAKKADTSADSFGTPEITEKSTTFNITPGDVSPAQSTIEIDPPIVPPFDGLTANGTDSYQVKMTLRDQYGNAVTGTRPEFGSNIVGDFFSQPLTPTDVNGETTGSISTTVADSNPSRLLSISSPSGLETVQVAAPFKPGSAQKLAFFVQPTNSPAGDLSMNEIKVAVQDAQGNIINTGADASASIQVSIASNVGGATLSGTTTNNAVNGVATFSDLGIDITANGYRLVASAGVLSPAYSNNFNITAGIPKVISMTGPTDVLSGACSTAITLQLQDFGGNPSKAVQNTTVQLSNMGSGSFYSSSTCGGSALGTNITFTPGTDTRTLYFRSSKVENLNIMGTDASSVLTQSNYNLLVTPNKMRLVAEAQPPAAPGTTLSVTAGQCSTEILIVPLADDGSNGQVFSATNVSVTGVLGSDAKIYSNPSCTNELDPNSVPLTVSGPPNIETRIYLKDPKGENLLINVSDPGGDISTVSLPQEVKVLASNINLTGPANVVAGACSSVFTVTLRDTLGNDVVATENIALDINGVDGVSATGQFYTSPACGGVGSATSVIVPNGSAQATVYFKGLGAEILNISMSDPNGNMATSGTVQLTVTPSAFRITAPVAGDSMTSECVGPFSIELLDGQNAVAAAVVPIQADLSGQGDAGKFYNDNLCENEISFFNYSAGQDTKTFYFKGQYPEANLTLTVTDNAGVLLADTENWQVISDWGWIGTASTQYDEFGDLLPFRTGIKPVAARYDGLYQPQQLAFTPDKKSLFVADYNRHKLVKYDYENNQYIGWVGRLRKENGIGSTGSNIPTPSTALCVSTNNYDPLPGWCEGGRPVNGDETIGGLRYPWGVEADNTYVYTTLYDYHMVARFRVDTGAFAGWIGFINNSSPTSAATGGPATCTTTTNAVTPGWCVGGNRKYHGGSYTGDGRMRYPRGMAQDNSYLYVGQEGAILRFDKATGAFTGWIGMVNATPTGGAAGCTIAGTDTMTPGWCTGGTFKRVHPYNHGGVQGGIYSAMDIEIVGTSLFVLESSYSGNINEYDVATGAFIQTLPNHNHTWISSQQFASDGTNFFVADDERILKVSNTGLIEGWMGKVANNAGMSGNAGCNTLQPNDNTPGWCIGGTHKPGLGETSFIDHWGITYDGLGSIIVTSRNVPALKKFNASTGDYEGSLALESISPNEWTSDRNAQAEYYGFDDKSTYNPQGTLVVGDYLFMTEYNGSRVKKIDLKTGELLGWIGGVTSKPTGGESAGCLAANGMGPSPGWCLGSNFYPTWTWNDINMIDDLTDGIMYTPFGLASDGTWLYVTDRNIHRIQRFNIATGAYGGWIGRINRSPTGGDPGCNGAPVDTFTPGWCLGGMSENGNGDGQLYHPTGITYQGGNLYVIDTQNHRVSSYQATTGAFNGWIGRIGSNPTSGCTPASNGNYNVATNGWCKGGTASRANYRNDRGGGFNFDYGYDRADIFSDGVHLYITNTRNIRIDKFDLNGNFIEATRTREDQYVNSWKSAQADVANVGNGLNCSYPMSVWVDATHIYGLSMLPCSRDGDAFSLWKMDKTTGQIIGWKGAVSATYPPTGGETGCAGATISTPGWCQGGRVAIGYKLGQFSGTQGSLTGDNNFLYIADRSGNRVIRVPK